MRRGRRDVCVRIGAAALPAALASLLGGCSREAEPTLRIGTNVWIGSEPLYLARELGHLDPKVVRLVEYPSASEVLRATLLLLAFWLSAGTAAAAPVYASSFSDWAAVVVAGDAHAHGGKPSEAFDNARRDVTTALVAAGFDPANIRQFSTQPRRYPDAHVGPADIDAIYEGLEAVAKTAKGGCLFYMTSHGAPDGAVLGERMLPPSILDGVLTDACPGRPAVAVISACFSGVFVAQLQAADRMILTAARRDRTSFGCGQTDKYPYFDDCFLASMPNAHDFADLGKAVQACVAAREKKEGAEPPSEPQLSIGAALRPMLPLLPFAR